MRALNLILAAAFLAVVALNWAIGRNARRPNFEAMPEMVRTAAYDSFSPNPNFADGKTLRPPVAGAIPRGYEPAGVAPEASALSRGAFVFATFCQPCHGAKGLGDGPVAARGVPPPPSLVAENARKMEDGQIFEIITNGRKNMPPHASQISREDRWKAILHVRSLQQGKVAP